MKKRLIWKYNFIGCGVLFTKFGELSALVKWKGGVLPVEDGVGRVGES